MRFTHGLSQPASSQASNTALEVKSSAASLWRISGEGLDNGFIVRSYGSEERVFHIPLRGLHLTAALQLRCVEFKARIDWSPRIANARTSVVSLKSTIDTNEVNVIFKF